MIVTKKSMIVWKRNKLNKKCPTMSEIDYKLATKIIFITGPYEGYISIKNQTFQFKFKESVPKNLHSLNVFMIMCCYCNTAYYGQTVRRLFVLGP